LERFLTDSAAERGPAANIGRTIIHETARGKLFIRTICPPGFFSDLKLDEGLGRFSHYSSIIHNLEAFETIASRKEGRVTLALLEPNLIVGYGTCWYPDPDERWSALGELMYEMSSVEVSRNFRGLQLAGLILEATMNEDFFEDKITYMCGFSWHWDLEGSGMNAVQYRQVMMRLYSRVGFREVYTNEPNIALREENVMMIRLGSRVTPEDRQRFRYLRFGVKPQQ
jgi:acetoin utilization protein AcuA